MSATVYLIPCVLADGVTQCIPAYVPEAAKKCTVFFVENERTARRYLKLLWKEMVIDDYRWYNIKEVSPAVANSFSQALSNGETIGILSEAGCPGVADPGQELVWQAQHAGAHVVPLVGPNAMLLALMASGLNGQQFRFVGYLPIEAGARTKAVHKLENDSRNNNSTQLFMETPYRNGQLAETLLKTCQPQTRLCIAADVTAETEFIQTKTIQPWQGKLPPLHKRPAIFLLLAT